MAKHLAPNDVAALRLVDKQTSHDFKEHTTIQLSEPVPPSLFAYWLRATSVDALSCDKRKELLYLTARTGIAENLALALAATGIVPDFALLRAAASSAQPQASDQLLDTLYPALSHAHKTWHDEALEVAARRGQWHLCGQLLVGHRGTSAWAAANGAIAAGHTALAEWLTTQALDRLYYWDLLWPWRDRRALRAHAPNNPHIAALCTGDLRALTDLEHRHVPCRPDVRADVAAMRAEHGLQEALRQLVAEGAVVDWARLVAGETLEALARCALEFVAAGDGGAQRARRWAKKGLPAPASAGTQGPAGRRLLDRSGGEWGHKGGRPPHRGSVEEARRRARAQQRHV
ncbi:hypothetical protein HYH03_016238 [Edaphochlamys debaryana]|uniref:Uncharacterized protein n=1 Tax=Edaphochlamys debaryana TaxID=47281 RepID=A0A836BQD9_9CHLO|nr:hypothetical protein HYH03_016238 [Edaphochlamys debaryana]|eukprot:KAG2485035.1 hypothetical protein HYH03_016238 [Edaphochlamys debaryana]